MHSINTPVSCLLVLLILLGSCKNKTTNQSTFSNLAPSVTGLKVFKSTSCEDLFNENLSFQFDFPIGDKDGKGSYIDLSNQKKHNGWYIATETGEEYSMGLHTGEDWNGNGGGNTDKGQPVYSISNGKVIHSKKENAPWGNVVIIEHQYIENAALKTIYSLYAHLDEIKVKKGAIVNNRQLIGTIGDANGSFLAHLHLEIRKHSLKDYSPTYWPSSNGKDVAWINEHYHDPSTFINEHRTIENPKLLPHLLIAEKSKHQMSYYQNGALTKKFEIALSQNPVGHKQKEGDLRLPEGQYKIIQKSRGPFSGSYSDYFGVAWMRLNYPNNFDARAAYQDNRITRAQLNAIEKANKNSLEPLRNTGLGAGIGIHGWAGDWDLNGNRAITWGCISMLNFDLDNLYKTVLVGTPIYILP